MPRTARKQRRQPYAWLGAGAVTLGLGAAMVGGAAVAAADTPTDSGASAAASPAAASGSAASNPASSSTASRRAPRGARAGTGPAAARPSRAAAAATPATEAPVVSAATSAPAPAAAVVAPRPRVSRHLAAAEAAVTPQTDTVAPAADIQPSDPPFIPNTIVPGAHVTLALNEIPASQTTLNQATWGAGNYAAGLAAIVPQLFLAEAQLSLTLWQNNMPGAQQTLAATAGIPIIQQLAEINLFVTATLPTFTQFGLTGASLFLPFVNLLGAATAPTQTLINQARSDGTVYAVTLVQMKSVVEPVITGSIGGGPRTQMLVDTGSSGLVTTLDQVGPDAKPTEQTGEIIYSGANTPFTYRVYETTVDFGGGAVTGTTYIDVIEDTPEQEALFKEFVASTGSNAILGTGASAVGPGPGYIPTSQLPGELSDGYLLNENLLFFGLFGVMIFGPNPFPARVSVPGSPYGQLQVQIGSGAKQPVTDAIIDSGGVYGTMPVSLFPTLQPGDYVPAGTKISVYTQDGQTLLYSYTTNSANGPYIVADDPFGMDVNTGYIPFNQQLIYTDYSAATYPNGATVFDIA